MSTPAPPACDPAPTVPERLQQPHHRRFGRASTVLQRTPLVLAHAQWVFLNLRLDWVEALYREGRLQVLNWRLGSSEADRHFMRVELSPGRDLGRQGALELHLLLDDSPVMRSTFSIVPADLLDERGDPDAHLMVIGSLQVPDGCSGKARELVHLTQRIRTRHLMLTLLQGLAQGWALAGLRGVGRVDAMQDGDLNRVGQVSRDGDGDGMWLDLGASETRHTHWVLPLSPVDRFEPEMASHQRAEHRRRCFLQKRLHDACAQWVQFSSPTAGEC